MDLITREWARGLGGKTALERWQNKIRHLRSFLRGWAKNLSGVYKMEKDGLLALIHALDI